MAKQLLVAALWFCVLGIYWCEPDSILMLTPKQQRQAFGLLAVQLVLVVIAIVVEAWA